MLWIRFILIFSIFSHNLLQIGGGGKSCNFLALHNMRTIIFVKSFVNWPTLWKFQVILCHHDQERTQKFFEGGPDFFFSYIFDFWEGSKKFSHTNFNLEGRGGGVRTPSDPPGYAHEHYIVKIYFSKLLSEAFKNYLLFFLLTPNH